MTTRLAERDVPRALPHGRMATPYGMSALETAVGAPYGPDGGGPARVASTASSPLVALQDALVPALRRTPCLVSFSGGRDSSVLLAAAVTAARGHGLPEPVPATLRFPGRPDTDETEWQERVVRHLGVDDWLRIELEDELDCVGPIARGRLLRHGPLFPPNACIVVPMAECACGGSLVMGAGGDELLGGWGRRRLADVLAGRERACARDAVRLAFSLAPRGVRRRVARRRLAPRGLPWLTPDAEAALLDLVAAEDAAEPTRWDRWTAMALRHRYPKLLQRTLGLLGDDLGVLMSTPLLDPGFVAALGRAGGWAGWGNRTAAMRAVFGTILPRDLVERSDKATFGSVFWSEHTRDFALSWSGRGLDEAIVDVEAVRRTWLHEPHHASAMLLQAAWLHDHRASA